MSQFKRGALVSYLGIIITNISGLILTPYIIKSLGDSEYGVYVLVGSLISYLIALDFGLNNSVTRYVSGFRLKNDHISEENFLAHISIMYLVIVCFCILFGILLIQNFNSIYGNSLSENELNLSLKLLPYLLLNVVLIIPGVLFTAYINAYTYFVLPKSLNLFKIIIRSLFVFLFLYIGFKAVAIVIIDTIVNGMFSFFLCFFCLKKLNLKIKLHHIDWNLFREVMYYSFWIFLASVVLKLQWQVGQAIVGLQIGAVAVGIFGVGIMLGGYYNAFAFAINSLVLPRAVQLVESENDDRSFTLDMIVIARYILCVLLLVSSGFYLIGENFILLWLDAGYLKSYYIALIIMIFRTIPLTQVYGNSILEAKGQNRYKSLLSLVTISIGALLAYILAPNYGLRGVFWPIISAMTIDCVLMNLYYRKKFDFKIKLFFKNTILVFLFPLSLIVIFFKTLLSYIVVDSWFKLISVICIYGMVYCIMIYIFVLNKDEKMTLINFFKKWS